MQQRWGFHCLEVTDKFSCGTHLFYASANHIWIHLHLLRICISFRTESDLDKVVRTLELKFNIIILKKSKNVFNYIPADGSLCCHGHMQNWPLGHVDLCQRAEGGRHVFLNPSEHLTVGREPDNVYSGQTGLTYKELKWSKWRAGFFNKLF